MPVTLTSPMALATTLPLASMPSALMFFSGMLTPWQVDEFGHGLFRQFFQFGFAEMPGKNA